MVIRFTSRDGKSHCSGDEQTCCKRFECFHGMSKCVTTFTFHARASLVNHLKTCDSVPSSTEYACPGANV
jgi:hypothetical protein